MVDWVSELFACAHAATLKSSQLAVSIQDLRMTLYFKKVMKFLRHYNLQVCCFFQTDLVFFMFASCISSIKSIFIIPNEAHYYKNHGKLKHFKIITLAPTCFGSRGNHHHNRLICCHNIDCVCTDEHRKTILCSFS